MNGEAMTINCLRIVLEVNDDIFREKYYNHGLPGDDRQVNI